MLRADVNEVDVDAVDLGDELRQGVQLRFDLAPVVFRPPIAHELLELCELHALRLIGNRFLVGPPRRVDAPAQIGERVVWNVDPERADGVAVGRRDQTRGKQTEGACGGRGRKQVAAAG